jgi:hypothetical protein
VLLGVGVAQVAEMDVFVLAPEPVAVAAPLAELDSVDELDNVDELDEVDELVLAEAT